MESVTREVERRIYSKRKDVSVVIVLNRLIDDKWPIKFRDRKILTLQNFPSPPQRFILQRYEIGPSTLKYFNTLNVSFQNFFHIHVSNNALSLLMLKFLARQFPNKIIRNSTLLPTIERMLYRVEDDVDDFLLSKTLEDRRMYR